MTTATQATIVDYGSGNLLSVARACAAVGADVQLSAEPAEIARAERLIVPGVGAFGDCMRALEQRGLLDAILRFVQSERPLLGICVGMQILLSVGEEFGETSGLGIIPGRVRAIPKTGADGRPHKVPHIGWNELTPPAGERIERWSKTPLAALAPNTAVYFVHSFAAEPTDPRHRLAECDYGGQIITAAVARDHICGTQFHPEKSGPAGLAILAAFLDVSPNQRRSGVLEGPLSPAAHRTRPAP